MTADQRILVGTAATLRWQPVDSDGTAAAPSGTVTVTVTRADGTAIVTGVSTAGASIAERTYSLSAANNTLLDRITATWLDAGTAVATTTIDVVGGYWASVAAIRASDETLANASRYSDAELIRARWETEVEFEDVLGYACVPRFHRDRYNGDGTANLAVHVAHVRTVRSARLYTSSTAYTSLTSTERSAVVPVRSADVDVLYRSDANTWPAGTANVLVELEHGLDRPYADLLRAFYVRVRDRANYNKGGARGPSVASQAADGVVIRYARPGVWGALTDDDRINEVVARRAIRAAA